MAFGARLGVKAGKLTGKLAKKVKHALGKDRFKKLQATAKKFAKNEHGGSSGKGKGSNKTSDKHNNDYVKDKPIPKYEGVIKYSNSEKILKQIKKRGWTEDSIREALMTKGIPAKGVFCGETVNPK